MNGLLILVPTLNENQGVARGLHTIGQKLPDAHILVIDDDSSDGTWQTAEALKAELPQLDVLVRRNLPVGLGFAVLDGYRYAIAHGYDEVCIIDVDLQQDPDDVRRMQQADPAADIVIGSRYARRGLFQRGYRLHEMWLSLACNLAINVMFLFPQRDVSTNFYLIRTRVFERVPPDVFTCMGFAFFSEVKLRAARAGCRIAEVAVPTYARTEGASKRSWRQVRRFAREILTLWFRLLFDRTRAPEKPASPAGDRRPS